MGKIEEDKERYAALAAAAKERNQPKRNNWFSAVLEPTSAPILADWERELLEPSPTAAVRNTGPGFCVCGCGLPIGEGGVELYPRPTVPPRRGIAAMPGIDRYAPRGPAIEPTPPTTNSEAWANLIRSTARTREETDNLYRTLNQQVALQYGYSVGDGSPRSSPGVTDPIQRG